ncbi:MAG: M50 family metallopeptidase [Vulcanimicrobiaceae bacterium]
MMLLAAQPLAFALPSLAGLGNIVVFLAMLSLLIVLHEAGHFILARRNGVRVNDFALGFGPTLVKWTSPRSGTNYRINLFPVGGYCAMQGEDARESAAAQQRSYRASGAGAGDNFQAKSPWQRLAILFAGPGANFLLAVALFYIGAVAFGVASSALSTEVGPVLEGSPAMRAGLQPGDRILTIDGVPQRDGKQMVTTIEGSIGKRLSIGLLRGGTVHTISVVPRAERADGKLVGRIGFAVVGAYRRVDPIRAIPLAFGELWTGVSEQVDGYAQLIRNPAKNVGEFSGPIGMERAAAAYQQIGWGPYLQLAATISIALGILNLLPLPALDGGRAAFVIAELIRRRPVEPEREALVHFSGFAVLVALMIFIAFHDISNIVSGKGVF